MIEFNQHPVCPKCWHEFCSLSHYDGWIANPKNEEWIRVECKRCKYPFRMHCADHREPTISCGEGMNGL